MKKINTTENFNAGASIVIPQKQLLHKNTSYDVQIVKVNPPVFLPRELWYRGLRSRNSVCLSVCPSVCHTHAL